MGRLAESHRREYPLGEKVCLPCLFSECSSQKLTQYVGKTGTCGYVQGL